MKRGRDVDLEEWVERVWRLSDEAPSELMCVWRREFGAASCAQVRIIFDNGVRLEDSATRRTLMWAHREAVTLYGPNDEPRPYEEWSARRGWPWEKPVAPDFCTLPGDVWLHIARVACAHLGPYETVRVASLPVSRRWAELWHRDRTKLLWRNIADKLPWVTLGHLPTLDAMCRKLRAAFLYLEGEKVIVQYARHAFAKKHRVEYHSQVVVSPNPWHITVYSPGLAKRMDVRWEGRQWVIRMDDATLQRPAQVFDFLTQ